MARYFLGKDGKVYKDSDLLKSLYLVRGWADITMNDLDLSSFRGIEKEVFFGVEDFISMREIVLAVKLYHEMENQKRRETGLPDISLKEARDYVKDLEMKMI